MPIPRIPLVLVTVLTTLLKGIQGYCSVDTSEVLTGLQGEISSPGFFNNSNYPGNQNCSWRVELDYEYSQANITFDVFQLHKPADCGILPCNDYLQVTDGKVGIFNYWGDIIFPYRVTPTKSFKIEFHTDGQGSDKGFHLSYTSVCQYNISLNGSQSLPAPPHGMPGPCKFRLIHNSDVKDKGLHIVLSSTNKTGQGGDCLWKIQHEPNQEPVCLAEDGVWSNAESPVIFYMVNDDVNDTAADKIPLQITPITKNNPCFYDNACSHHGKCVATGGPDSTAYKCECNDGYLGNDCEIPDPCIDNPCQNNGHCSPNKADISLPNCTCADAFSGKRCTEFDPCFGRSCVSADTCFKDGAQCGCKEGYIQPQCTRFDHCVSGPCKNGALCKTTTNDFKCACTSEFIGKTCEIPDDNTYCRQDVYQYGVVQLAWSATKIGHTDIQPCPPGVYGNASRKCDSRRGVFSPVARWEQPDLSGCVSQLFLDIRSQVEAISEPQELETPSFLNITSSLKQATDFQTSNDAVLYPGDLTMATSLLHSLANLVSKSDGDYQQLKDMTQGYGDVVNNIVHRQTAPVWRYTKLGYLEDQVTSLLQSVEMLSSHVADKTTRFIYRRRRSQDNGNFDGRSFVINTTNLNVEISVQKRENVVNGTVFGEEGNSSQISLPRTVFYRALQSTEDRFISSYTAKFSSISELLVNTNKYFTDNSNCSTRPVVNSDIMSAKILNVPEEAFQDLDVPVEIIFTLKNTTLTATLEGNCVFLNMSAFSEADRWSTEGCRKSLSRSNSSHVVCYCRHLTNFAVLMDIYEVENRIDGVNMQILTYLSYAGGGLSVLCCLVSIAVYEFFRLRNERVRIHQQLAVTIILVQLFFLVGIDRTENRYVCMAMAMCLHYFLTAMFCWMLVEGAHLYLLLVKVFKASSHLAKYVAIGWGVPVVLVGITAGIFHDEYGNDEVCWLSHKVLLVAFVPTVGLVILINTVVLMMVMRTMIKSLATGSKATTEERSAVRAGLKAAAILLPLLGLTWTLGFLSITSKETLIFTYLFTLFNTLQGVFFFVFHCLLSVDVQNAYDRRSRRLSQKRLTESSFSKPRDRKGSERDSSPYSTYYSKSSLHTVMTDMSNASLTSTGRRRSNRSSTGARTQSVTFDDDVFLSNGISSQPSLHRRDSYETVLSDRSTDTMGLNGSAGYINDPVLNNSLKRQNSTETNGYLLYFGKGRENSVANTHSDSGQVTERNDLYAHVHK